MTRRYSLAWSDGTIAIDGPISGNAISAAVVRRTLCELQEEPALRVMIQSDGGSTDEGLAIFSLLRNTGKPIDVTVRWAGSMAGVIAMAGTRIRVQEGGGFGLHNARVTPVYLETAVNAGSHITAAQIMGMARNLTAIDEMHVDIFQHRTGLDRHVIRSLRAAETAIDAQEAVRLGFADEVIDA